jgi:NADH dehydrogenase [ubiquinone] 1 alpha subcomplex assembly factor 5
VEVIRKQLDEERLLETIDRNSQDVVVSCLSLHWVNDLPGECAAFYVASVWPKS